ncbi:MAG: glycoside hydrolase family 127 protein [Oscillospiraceae bacterium]|nr:glycoside hydrolase family 127 protein [Oscillospiraceae bacterium]
MKTFKANNPNIIYIGSWNDCDSSKTAKFNFAKCFVLFKGSALKLNATGELLCSVDGGADCAETEFSLAGGVHTLMVTVNAGTRLDSIEADAVLNVNEELQHAFNDELLSIVQGREGTDPATWQPVTPAARRPETDVKLGGLFGQLFEQNVARIKRCAADPDTLDLPEGAKRDLGWVDWLPASLKDGRIMGGAAKALRWGEDADLRTIVDNAIDRIESTMRPDGWYNYYPESEYAVNYYPNVENSVDVILSSEKKSFDRIFWSYGMIAAGKCGNAKAYTLIRRMYDWLEASPYATQLLLAHNSTNSLTGNLVLAESVAGKVEDMLFSQTCLDKKTVLDGMAALNPVIFSNYPADRPHCYCIMDILAALSEYRLTGQQRYLDAALGGWDVYNRYYKHLGAVTAICEQGGPYYPGSYQMDIGHTGETCGTMFWLWLNLELLELFPDEEKYAAQIEEGLLNVLPSAFMGRLGVRYHNVLQGRKDDPPVPVGDAVGSCCEMTTTLTLGDCPQYTFLSNKDGLWLHQLMSYDARCGDWDFCVDSDILHKHQLTFTVRSAPAREQFVKLRVPAWAKDAEIRVNGEAASAVAGTFAQLKRVWQTGDTVTLTFSPALTVLPYTGVEQAENGKGRFCVTYGPYLMALTGIGETKLPTVTAAAETLRVERTENSVEIRVNDGMIFRPYFEVPGDADFNCFPIFEP